MSGDSLSQEQIDALLSGASPDELPEAPDPVAEAVAQAEAAATAAPAEDVETDADADADADGEAAEGDAGADADAAADGGDAGAGGGEDEGEGPSGAAGSHTATAKGELTDLFEDLLTPEERDTLGEIGNISMASAATTLSTLLNNQVLITTPTVITTTEAHVVDSYDRPAALVRIGYTEGLHGTNVFIISTHDASIVADLMMGGAGTPSETIDAIASSAVGEAMNQMMGAAATSMANMFGRRVDISAPDVQVLDLSDHTSTIGLVNTDDPMVCARFDLQVGDLLSTTLMQLMPLEFAKEVVAALLPPEPEPAPEADADAEDDTEAAYAASAAPAGASAGPGPQAGAQAAAPPPQAYQQAPPVQSSIQQRPDVVAQPAAFPTLGDGPASSVPGDIGLLMDVPLQVSVELGRTELRIRNVLELVPGSIIELDRLAGEPVDVLVNGKHLARGEVVVIDEEFGIRITDIASQANRLRGIADG